MFLCQCKHRGLITRLKAAVIISIHMQRSDFIIHHINLIKLFINRKPFELIDWQEQIIRNIFGLLKPNGYRQFNTAYIEKFIESLGERFNIREIAFDRWGAVQMVQNLEGMGFTVVPFGQGFKDMSPPTKELMKLVLEQKIAHGGHPVLCWMMDNIFIRTDPAGNIKPDKEKSTEKIDGAVATIMALDRAIRCGNDNKIAVLEEGMKYDNIILCWVMHNGGNENGHYYRVTINPIIYDNVSERISVSGALRVTFMTRNVGDSLSTPVSCSTGNTQLNYQSIGSRAG